MIRWYGLKNCDTCRKAGKWLTAEGLDHVFIDVRTDGLDAQTVARWVAAVGWEVLVNKRGTTWRRLDAAAKDIAGPDAAIALMVCHPALIKRPIFMVGAAVLVGFDDAVRGQLKG